MTAENDGAEERKSNSSIIYKPIATYSYLEHLCGVPSLYEMQKR